MHIASNPLKKVANKLILWLITILMGGELNG